jgi:hypothetical protein
MGWCLNSPLLIAYLFGLEQEHPKTTEFKGLTKRPESEQRAIFVEVKCVGCLKCALLAEKTFAIESVYGKARVVSRWTDLNQKFRRQYKLVLSTTFHKCECVSMFIAYCIVQ